MESITKEQLIALLNEDIALEYSAAIQYIQHYAVMSGAEFDAVRAHLLQHSEEEIGHAVLLSDRVNYMGGVPSAEVAPIKGSSDPLGMLQINAESEKNAVARYKERIAQAQALGEFGLVQLLQGILMDEEEHENDILTSLGAHAKTEEVVLPVEEEPSRFSQVVLSRFASLREERSKRSAV